MSVDLEETELSEISEEMREEKEKASMWRMTFNRLKQDPLALFGIGVFSVFLFCGIFAPILAPYDPTTNHWGHFYEAPSLTYPLGTDGTGRDILSVILFGSRISLIVGAASVALIILIALITGALAGYFGGWVDEAFMRVVDIMLAIPSLPLIILLISVVQIRGIWIIVLSIGITGWLQPARVIRSQFLSLKSLPYTEAAKAMGASDFRIIFRHILPNALSPIVVISSYRMASAILTEAALAYLGLGDPTVLSWGRLISSGRMALRHSWWIATFPGIAILVAVLALNVLGDGLRRALDVKQVR